MWHVVLDMLGYAMLALLLVVAIAWVMEWAIPDENDPHARR